MLVNVDRVLIKVQYALYYVIIMDFEEHLTDADKRRKEKRGNQLYNRWY